MVDSVLCFVFDVDIKMNSFEKYDLFLLFLLDWPRVLHVLGTIQNMITNSLCSCVLILQTSPHTVKLEIKHCG